jgi:hypothetical protein
VFRVRAARFVSGSAEGDILRVPSIAHGHWILRQALETDAPAEFALVRGTGLLVRRGTLDEVILKKGETVAEPGLGHTHPGYPDLFQRHVLPAPADFDALGSREASRIFARLPDGRIVTTEFGKLPDGRWFVRPDDSGALGPELLDVWRARGWGTAEPGGRIAFRRAMDAMRSEDTQQIYLSEYMSAFIFGRHPEWLQSEYPGYAHYQIVFFEGR